VAPFGGIVAAVIGFALWDRRTMIRPFEKRIKPLEEDAEKLHRFLKALRKLAEKNQELADVLRSFSLL
jgi:predicted ribosome quality control (RQC) complex YloA/Tae2 family protein